MQFFNGGLDELHDIASGSFVWALWQDLSAVDRDMDFLSDLTPGTNEISVTGYIRQSLSGGARTVDDTADLIHYDADDPNFGTMDPGQNVAGITLSRFNGSDSAARLIGWELTIGTVTTDSLTPFIVPISGGRIATVQQV